MLGESFRTEYHVLQQAKNGHFLWIWNLFAEPGNFVRTESFGGGGKSSRGDDENVRLSWKGWVFLQKSPRKTSPDQRIRNLQIHLEISDIPKFDFHPHVRWSASSLRGAGIGRFANLRWLQCISAHDEQFGMYFPQERPLTKSSFWPSWGFQWSQR